MVPTDKTGEECKRCHKKALYGIEDRCRACNHPRPPNVRFARDFVQSVEDRFQEVCKSHGTRPGLKKFQRFAKKTGAVVNMEIEFACSFFKAVNSPADPGWLSLTRFTAWKLKVP